MTLDKGLMTKRRGDISSNPFKELIYPSLFVNLKFITMRFPNVSIIAFITFLSIILNAHWGLTISSSNLPWKTSEVQLEPNYQILNQNLDNRKTRADKLLQQATEQIKAEQALEIYREISDREGERKALDSLGQAYSLMGNYSKALEYYDQSLAILQDSHELIAQELDNTQPERIAQDSLPPTFFSMMNQGRTYRAQNNYAKAVEHFEQALTFAQESNNLEQESHALSELGSAYLSLGNYAKALAYNQEYLVIVRKRGNPQWEYLALSTLGSNYSILGDNANPPAPHPFFRSPLSREH
ncbi:MAG: tetratricopeptide repeat protein [Symploca sp. SIO2C1]|nr:tetratricopeptide repeat protein [Symploca sp. SIO2C1]